MADPATPPAVSFLVKKEKSEKESGLSGGGGGASSPKQSKKGESFNVSKRKREADEEEEESFSSSGTATKMRKFETSSYLESSEASSSVSQEEMSIDKKEVEEMEPSKLDNNQESPLLAFLSSPKSAYVSDLLVEYIVSGDGGPQAILNLREVCSGTKRWIDTLRPSLAKPVFDRLPIKFQLSRTNLEMFHKCPPPPSASFLALELTSLKKNTPYFKIPQSVRKNNPTFFSFWTFHMQTLKVDIFSPTLVEVLGLPASVQNLQCGEIGSSIDPNQYQLLERISFNGFSGNPRVHTLEVRFFRRLAEHPNLKELSTKILRYGYFGFRANPFEGLQLIIDAKRGDANFQFKINLDDCWPDSYGIDTENFFSSVVASSSPIRLVPAHFNLLTRYSPGEESKRKTLFKSVESLNLSVSASASAQLSANNFPNMKTIHANIPVMSAEQWNLIQFPNTLENLYVSSHCYFTPRNLPPSIKYLNIILNQRFGSWSPQEWVEFFNVISESCPFLRELVIEANIPVGTLSSWKPPPELPRHNFQNLKMLTFTELNTLERRQRFDFDPQYSTRSFLFHILQVQRMTSLQKLCVGCRTGSRNFKVVVDWLCVNSLANSPLANTLESVDMKTCNIRPEARECYEEFQEVVRKNKWGV